MVKTTELCIYLENLLKAGRFRDYCPNGLQVQGCEHIQRLVSGVTACQDLIEAAIERDADALLVHHGYFWKGEEPVLTGMKAKRIKRLLEAGINLFAYHLPLDAHDKFGNNAQLAIQLKLKYQGWLDAEQPHPIAMFGELAKPMNGQAFKRQIATALQREPLWIDGAVATIQRVGWCTGAAQDYIQYAVQKGLDAFISGEVSERTTHIAREENIHYFAVGHHASERYGVQALGQHLAQQFGLEHHYIDIDNPV